MTETKGKSKSENRYSSIDSTPWVIKDSLGKKIGSDSYTGYKEASTAANRYTNETGEFAGAVRS